MGIVTSFYGLLKGIVIVQNAVVHRCLTFSATGLVPRNKGYKKRPFFLVRESVNYYVFSDGFSQSNAFTVSVSECHILRAFGAVLVKESSLLPQ